MFLPIFLTHSARLKDNDYYKVKMNKDKAVITFSDAHSAELIKVGGNFVV